MYEYIAQYSPDLLEIYCTITSTYNTYADTSVHFKEALFDFHHDIKVEIEELIMYYAPLNSSNEVVDTFTKISYVLKNGTIAHTNGEYLCSTPDLDCLSQVPDIFDYPSKYETSHEDFYFKLFKNGTVNYIDGTTVCTYGGKECLELQVELKFPDQIVTEVIGQDTYTFYVYVN